MATRKQIDDFHQFIMSMPFTISSVQLRNPDGYVYTFRHRKLDVTKITPIEGVAFEKKVCDFLNIDGRNPNTWPAHYADWYKSRHGSSERQEPRPENKVIKAGVRRHSFTNGQPPRVPYKEYYERILDDLKTTGSTPRAVPIFSQSQHPPVSIPHKEVAVRPGERKDHKHISMAVLPTLHPEKSRKQLRVPSQGFVENSHKPLPLFSSSSNAPGMGEQPDIVDVQPYSGPSPSHVQRIGPKASSFRAASSILLRYKEYGAVQQSAFIRQYFPPRGCPDLNNPGTPQEVLAELIEASVTNGMRVTDIQVLAAMEVFIKAASRARRDKATLYLRMARALESVAPC